SSAQLELRLNGDTMLASSYVQNNGPVDAMYVAIMDRLRGAYPDADSVNIVGFGVSLAREEGAASPVRVYIGFGNHERRWGCIGVSTNIMEAAKEALEKGVNHYFLKA
ncbi:citramalate synthase, partial [Candidatus Woesearchaeota archaeon]|nr:citramalate synthase [Candidatus Woesearchaeota archaeon]